MQGDAIDEFLQMDISMNRVCSVGKRLIDELLTEKNNFLLVKSIFSFFYSFPFFVL